MTLEGFTHPVGVLSKQGDLCTAALVGDTLTLRLAPNPNVAVCLHHLTALALIEQPKGSDLQCTLAGGIGTLGPFTVPGIVRFTFEYLSATSTAYVVTFPTDAIRHPNICPGRPLQEIRQTLRSISREVILANARSIFVRGARWDSGDLVVQPDPRVIPETINLRPYMGS